MNYPNLPKALAAFGASQPRFINESENAVFEVRANGQQAALRLHRAGYQDAKAIRSELWWMRALAQAGLPVPRPLPALDGALTAEMADGQMASMVSWIEGAQLGSSSKPLAGGKDRQAALFFTIGQTLAKLHNITDTLTFPDWFSRHSWDIDGLLGEAPTWGRFWENPCLSADEVDLIMQARTIARERLETFQGNGGDFGLIHADAIRGNTFVHGDKITLIDFDDAGFGFRLYDLGVLMTQNQGLENTADLQAAAIAGYRSKRDLSDEAERLLPMFIMLRRMASMGWIVPRAEPGSDWLQIYTDRAVDAAREFLG